MSSAFTIRKPVPKDLPSIKSIIDANELFPSEMMDDMIQPFFDNDECQDVWFVEVSSKDESQPVAAVVYCGPEKMSEGTYNAWLLAVDPSFHRKGCGRRIMKHLEENLAEEKQARLLLVETSGNDEYASARSFYEAIGFSEEARIREFYQAGEDKIVYRKKLVSPATGDK